MADSAQPRILLVAGKYSSPDGREPWLLDDLSQALQQSGALVDVVVFDVKHPRGSKPVETAASGVRILRVSPRAPSNSRVGTVIRHIATAVRLHTTAYKFVRSNMYDLCIYTSIGITSAGFPRRLRRKQIVQRSTFVLWDFFPLHHLEIGRIKQRWLHPLLINMERACFANADTVAVMSEKNRAFLETYHGRTTGVHIVRPWTSDALVGEKVEETRRNGAFTVLFGGQVAPGRGVDTLLRAAEMLAAAQSPTIVEIVGWGPLLDDMRSLAVQQGLSNVRFLDPMPRDDYRRHLRHVHAGIAATVPGVSVPTFPSKIGEYCAARLPVIASLESGSDAGTLLESFGAGISVPAGDAAALASAITQLQQEHDRGVLEGRAAAARRLFEEEFSANRAAARLLANL